MPPSIRPLRLQLCVQMCPEIPSELPADLAAICNDILAGREPDALSAATESRILTVYDQANAANPRTEGGLARALGRAALRSRDFLDLIPGAIPNATDRQNLLQQRGMLVDLPEHLQSLLPATILSIEFGAPQQSVLRFEASDPGHEVVPDFEREYLAGILLELLAKAGWSEAIQVVDLSASSDPIENTTRGSSKKNKAELNKKDGKKKSKKKTEIAGPGSGLMAVVLRWSSVPVPASAPARNSTAPREEIVVRKSAELLKERKELLTAVEYLHLANTELERQIRMNKRELEMARNIQKGFVPRRIPDWKGLQFWVKFFPMAEVSGDFYDYFTLGSNKLGIMVCDVSGHGVPAALISAIAKLSFKSHNLDSPAEVFSKVNLDLLNYVKKEGYLTSFYMIINAQNEIVYSVGAAPPPMLLRAKSGEVEKLAGKGTLLGMFPDAGKLYEDRTTHLEPGDKLFVFTDGLTEARNRHDDFLDEAELVRVIQETRDMDVQRACEHVMEFYDQYTVGRDVDDDLTLITMVLSEREEEFNDLVREARRIHNDGQVTEACEILREATTIFPRHTPSLFLLGKYLFQAQRFGEATDYLNQYNALKPYNADSYTILAECALLSKNAPLAIDHIKRSLSLRTENPGALYLAARVYDSVGRREEALEAFRELEHLRPRDHRTEEIRDLLDI